MHARVDRCCRNPSGCCRDTAIHASMRNKIRTSTVQPIPTRCHNPEPIPGWRCCCRVVFRMHASMRKRKEKLCSARDFRMMHTHQTVQQAVLAPHHSSPGTLAHSAAGTRQHVKVNRRNGHQVTSNSRLSIPPLLRVHKHRHAHTFVAQTNQSWLSQPSSSRSMSSGISMGAHPSNHQQPATSRPIHTKDTGEIKDAPVPPPLPAPAH